MTQTKLEAKATPVRVSMWRGIPPRSWWTALSLLAAGLILTALAALYVKAEVEAAAQREFDFICNEIQINVADRLAHSAQLLYSGAAFFDASGPVARAGWRTFTERLQIEQQLPGIQGIGFAVLIPPEQLEQHVQEVRGEGFPEYQVRPAGERELYSSIVYLEPFTDRNLRAFGYDMFSEPVRRAAMEQARDENIAVLSGKVILVQETEQDVQAGTLMYVPVYRRGLPIDTVEQRRAAIIGWVYSPYRMTDLMNGTLGNWEVKQADRQINLQVYDDDVMSTESLLYDSQNAADQALAPTALVNKLTPVDFAGRRWTLRFTQLGGLASMADYDSVWFVVFGGSIISALLFGLTLSLLSTRVNAQRMAEQLTTELRANEEKYRRLFDNAPLGIFQASLAGQVISINPAFAHMLGYDSPADAMNNIQDVATDLFADPNRRAETIRLMVEHPDLRTFENVYRRKDGSAFIGQLHALLVRDAEGRLVRTEGMVEDITERKQAEAKIQATLEEKETLLREVHHRVKNNLQVIIALIKMRARATQDAATLQFLKELESQARTMSLVYEQLYQSENLAQVNMAQYLRQLTFNVLDTYGRRDSLQFHLDAPLLLDVAQATPCGLIVNELFSNILKHAFPPGFKEKPTVSITLRREDKTYHLTVSDNGVGFPPGYDWRAGQSMGLRLVNLWATHQLGGTLTVSGETGATFAITFGLEEERDQ